MPTDDSNRRVLHFRDMDELLADIDALDEAGASRIRAAGNWTPGQIVHHVACFITPSIDGFGFKGPLGLRLIGRVMRKRMLTKTFPAGLTLPKSMSRFAPPDDATWDDAVALLRREVGRIRDGARMTHASPMLGALSHEEWVNLHCRHAELHFSFLHSAAGDESRD